MKYEYDIIILYFNLCVIRKLILEKRIRLQDIADKTGISVSTVHRALTRPDKVSAQVYTQVHEASEALGYEPNLIASTLSSKKKMNFAMLCPYNAFYEQIIAGAQSAVNELQVYGVTLKFIHSKEYSFSEQLEQLNEIIENMEYAGIAIAPAHTQLLNPLIDKLTGNGVPVITFDNDIPNSSRKYYIGQNPKIAGETAAFLYDTILPEGSVVAVMGSYVDAYGLAERLRCFKEYLISRGKLRVTDNFQYFDSIDGAYEMCGQILVNIKPAAIFSNSMLGTIGCARAVKEKGLTGKVFMVGFDIIDEIKGYLLDGTIFASLHHTPFTQGNMAVRSLLRLCKGMNGNSGDCFYINTNVILKTNVEEFMNALY